MIESKIKELGYAPLPDFGNTRIMMMPFKLEDNLPEHFIKWQPTIDAILKHSPVKKGVAYITIDEAVVGRGQTHRRPGMHVDGRGAYGGGGGGYAANGMYLVSSHVGCRGWNQSFIGNPGNDGASEHLAPECLNASEVVMQPNQIYWCSPMAVHEALPMTDTVSRQLLRLSLPSDAPWHEGYTVSPVGVLPTGPIHGPRTSQMAFRA